MNSSKIYEALCKSITHSYTIFAGVLVNLLRPKTYRSQKFNFKLNTKSRNSGSDGKGEWSEMVGACVEEG